MAVHGEWSWEEILDEGVEVYDDLTYDDEQADESVTLRCVNPKCRMYWHERDVATPVGETWHPRTFTEYQGVEPHGGYVDFYEDDAFDCPECGQEGEEV